MWNKKWHMNIKRDRQHCRSWTRSLRCLPRYHAAQRVGFYSLLFTFKKTKFAELSPVQKLPKKNMYWKENFQICYTSLVKYCSRNNSSTRSVSLVFSFEGWENESFQQKSNLCMTASWAQRSKDECGPLRCIPIHSIFCPLAQQVGFEREYALV